MPCPLLCFPSGQPALGPGFTQWITLWMFSGLQDLGVGRGVGGTVCKLHVDLGTYGG